MRRCANPVRTCEGEIGRAEKKGGNKAKELSLSATEVKMCRIMKRVELRGKFGLRVALILTPNMLSNIATMMEVREKANVEGNYLFCRPNSNRPYRGADALSECVRKVSLGPGYGNTWPHCPKYMKFRKHHKTSWHSSWDIPFASTETSAGCHWTSSNERKWPRCYLMRIWVVTTRLRNLKTSRSIRKVSEMSLNTILLSLI